MLKLLNILLLSQTIACGVVGDILVKIGHDPREFETSHPDFEPYKRIFENEYEHYTGISINLNNIYINYYGNTYRSWCEHNEYDGEFFPEIFISPRYWNEVSEQDREYLIKHELGHCFLHKAHDNRTHRNIPTTIIHKNQMSGNRYYYRKEAYDRELYLNDRSLILSEIDKLDLVNN